MKRAGLGLCRKIIPRLYKNGAGRLDWKHWESREASAIVKGTNRRVVVIKSPDPRIFEEAIFVIKEDLFHRSSDADQVLAEAKKAANAYLKKTMGPKRQRAKLKGPLLAVASTAAAELAWIAAHFVGV